MATDPKTPLAGPSRPLGSPEIPQFYLPEAAGKGVFAPKVYGAARIQFVDRKRKIDETRRVAFITPVDAATRTVDWESATPTTVMPDALKHEPAAKANYLPLPSGAMQLKTFTRWAKNFDRWLARTQRFEVAAATETTPADVIPPKRGGVSVELVAIVWGLQ